MKLIVASLTILVLPKLLLADNCAVYVSKDAADKIVEFIRKQKQIINYCYSCPNKPVVRQAECEIVKEVKDAQDDKGAKEAAEKESWTVLVNGTAKDLCNIYYKTDQGRWRNLAVNFIELGVLKIEFDIKDEEFIRDDALYYDAAGKYLSSPP